MKCSSLSTALVLMLLGCGPGGPGGDAEHGDESGTTSTVESESGSESETGTGTEPETGTETETGTEPACGDGSLDEGEDCDDGNLVDGDGCSADCELEPGGFIGSLSLDEPPDVRTLGVLGPSTPGGKRRLVVTGNDWTDSGSYGLIVHALELDGSSSWITVPEQPQTWDIYAYNLAEAPDGGVILGGFEGWQDVQLYHQHLWLGALDLDGAWRWEYTELAWDSCDGVVVRADETIAAVGGQLGGNQILQLSLAGEPLAVGSPWGEGLAASSLVELPNGELVAGAFSRLNFMDPGATLPNLLRVAHFDALGEPLAIWSQSSPSLAQVRTNELLVEGDQVLIAAASRDDWNAPAQLTWIGAQPSGPEAAWWSSWPRPFGATFASYPIELVAHPEGGAWMVAQTADDFQIVLSRWEAGADAPSKWTTGPAGYLRAAVALPEENLLAVLVAVPNEGMGRIDLYML